MTRQRPKALHTLLTRRSLSQFHDFTERFRRWQQLLARCLHESQLSHCRVLNIRDGQLIIEVDSAAWATRIKLQQSRIITHFNQEATDPVRQLDVKVKPASFQPLSAAQQTTEKPSPQTKEAKSTPVSSTRPQNNSADALRAQAEQCEEPLRSQLLKLAAAFAAAEQNEGGD